MDFHQPLKNHQINYQILTLKPTMSTDAINAINYLSKEYGFDANEKMRLMIEDGTIKAPKEKKEKKEKEKKEKKEKEKKEKEKEKKEKEKNEKEKKENEIKEKDKKEKEEKKEK